MVYRRYTYRSISTFRILFCKHCADDNGFAKKYLADTKANYLRMVAEFFVCLLLFPFSLFSISDVYIIHCVRQTPDDVPKEWKDAAAAMELTKYD